MISVIIPVYNAVSCLAACLDSVLSQSYTDFELLLVDDGSTDGSGDLCDDYVCRDARVSVFHQENGGPSSARNRALDVAQGEYIAFIDSDDVVHSQYLEVMVRGMEESQDVDVIRVSSCIVSSLPSRLDAPLSSHASRRQMTGNEALLDMLYQRPSSDSAPWGKLFRRSLFDGLRFPVAFRVYEDLYLMAQLLPVARQVLWIDLPVYYYCKQQTGTLNSQSITRRDAFDVLQTLEAQYMVTGQTRLVRAARERRLSVAFNILRLLSHQPHTDANIVMAHHCWTHIKALRRESLRDSKARFKNRFVALFSYLINR